MMDAHEVEAELRQAARLLFHVVAQHRPEQRKSGEIGAPESRGRAVLKHQLVLDGFDETALARWLLPCIEK